MFRHGIFVRSLLGLLVTGLCLVMFGQPVHAATVDPYVIRYLKVTDSVELPVDSQGKTRAFSAAELSDGKRLFAQNCINCHVGGTTLPNPIVSLSLASLQGATPPRDNINALVAYMREPFSYDGSEPIYWCRTVPESWMPQETIEHLAAFIVRAAQRAPAWGTNDIDQ
jgi:photosystem II cytochrome c550